MFHIILGILCILVGLAWGALNIISAGLTETGDYQWSEASVAWWGLIPIAVGALAIWSP